MGVSGDRLDTVARRLARRDTNIRARNSVGSDATLDSVARALAAPVTRRRAMLVTGGGILAVSLLKPVRASAQSCPSGGPNRCASGDGAVCVPADLACCSNENCAIACPYPWRVCAAPARCDDTRALCTHPRSTAGAGGRTQFCSKVVTVVNGCVDAGEAPARRGWCCRPLNIEVCGEEFNECQCITQCGSNCCKSDEECVGRFFKECKPICRKGWHREGDDCVCDTGQTCGVSCCKGGTVCLGGSSCGKPPPPTPTWNPFDAFSNWGDTAAQTAAGHQAQRRRAAFAAQSGTPVAAALTALAAVNAQGTAAGLALRDDAAADKAFKRRVVPSTPALPKLAAGEGLAPQAAAALDALLANQSEAFALALACAAALARARGAANAGSVKRLKKQTVAAAGFASRAADALQDVPALRAAAAKALRDTGTAEVTVTLHQVWFIQAEGMPADLRAACEALGLRGEDLDRAAEALDTNSEGGPVLIAPLEHQGRTGNTRDLQSGLAKYAKQARRNPMQREKPGPKRYRQ